jgi:hypothetical protein
VSRDRYRCAASQCRATFAHPNVEECPTVSGRCAHLMNAGWRPVNVRLEASYDGPRKPKTLQVHGAWICPTHVEELS